MITPSGGVGVSGIEDMPARVAMEICPSFSRYAGAWEVKRVKICLLPGCVTGGDPGKLPEAMVPYDPAATVVTGVLSIRTLVLFFKVRKTLKLPVTMTSPG